MQGLKTSGGLHWPVLCRAKEIANSIFVALLKGKNVWLIEWELNRENQGGRKKGRQTSEFAPFPPFFAKLVRLPGLQGRFPLFRRQVEGLDPLNCLNSDFTNVNYMRKLESGGEGRRWGENERAGEKGGARAGGRGGLYGSSTSITL